MTSLWSRFHLGLPAIMSIVASGLVAVGGLTIAGLDGLEPFGQFVVVQSVAFLLVIPMMWGTHVNASRALLQSNVRRATITTTASLLVAATCAAGAVLYLAAVFLLDWMGLVELGLLWQAAPLAGSICILTLAESLVRARSAAMRASATRLVVAVGYVTAVIALVVSGSASLGRYVAAMALANVVGAAIMMTAAGRPARRLDRDVLRRLWCGGRSYTASQGLLHLLFGLDLVIVAHLVGTPEAAVYTFYIGASRRVLDMLFRDSLASLMIASLSRRTAVTGRALARRLAAPALLVAAAISLALTLLALIVTGNSDLIDGWWLLLSAPACAAYTVLVLLTALLTIHPELGLASILRTLGIWTVPGLGVQVVAVLAFGTLGMVAAFGVLSVLLCLACYRTLERSETTSS